MKKIPFLIVLISILGRFTGFAQQPVLSVHALFAPVYNHISDPHPDKTILHKFNYVGGIALEIAPLDFLSIQTGLAYETNQYGKSFDYNHMNSPEFIAESHLSFNYLRWHTYLKVAFMPGKKLNFYLSAGVNYKKLLNHSLTTETVGGDVSEGFHVECKFREEFVSAVLRPGLQWKATEFMYVNLAAFIDAHFGDDHSSYCEDEGDYVIGLEAGLEFPLWKR